MVPGGALVYPRCASVRGERATPMAAQAVDAGLVVEPPTESAAGAPSMLGSGEELEERDGTFFPVGGVVNPRVAGPKGTAR